MSINQYSSDIRKTPWWSRQQQQQQQQIIEKSSSSSGPGIEAWWARQAQQPRSRLLVSRGLNLNKEEEEEEEELEELEAEAEDEENNNNNGSCSRSGEGEGEDDDDEEEEEEEREEGGGKEEKERMFEKALTPSDVGKLNRLVIPKQHAEKHFPLSDSGGENKGVLLSFEDESGRFWRFRYSYWNSSQSYVLTKGWSRYVKDKRLHAGDVVSFLRHPSLPHRLFIAWRPRPHNHLLTTRPMAVPPHHSTTTTPFYTPHPYPAHPHPFPFPPQTLHAPGRGDQYGENQITRASGNSPKVLRLFGVNMECQAEEAGDHESGPHMMMSSSSSTTPHHFYHYHHLQPSHASNNPHHHMDVNQMRYRPG